MKKYDIVIIGGGPAGVQSAISARNSNPDKSIALIRKEKVALVPCGIPYTLHSLKSVDEDIMPDTLLQKNNTDIIHGEVEGRDGKTLKLKDDSQIRFDKLILATGSVPIKPTIPGIDNDNIYILSKDYEYLKKMRAEVNTAQSIVIVGGGYVGVELADELAKKKIKVTLIEKMPGVLPTSVDPEFGHIIQKELENHGVNVITNVGVDGFSNSGKNIKVELENGDSCVADHVIISIGFKPDMGLARKFGLEVNDRFGIIVDEYMKTSDDDIFAAGDCVAKRSYLAGDFRSIMLASTAMSQGRLAGSNLFSINILKAFHGTLGSFATKVGNIAVGATGLTETRAREMKLEYCVGVAEGVDRHPAKLPKASKMNVKLIFAKNSHILLGAQVSGGDSVGECVNMLSVMIQKSMTDMEIDTLQIGTHPLLTPSPLAYGVINATVDAIMKWYH
ncbi:MAG: NAD(P)/FAD-dependent oxidoreductase [candidate division Zixibacteria bacterium]|nr:NAD(P)/FAD-dependent oxidoreductase [candidate division Zixibacteria bacterium]